MATLRNLSAILLTVAMFVVQDGSAVDLECQGVDMKFTEQQVTHLKECANSVGAKDKSELTIEKFPCFAKCIFEHKKLVDEKGLPHKENIMNMLAETMPDNVKEALTAGMGKCLDEHVKEIETDDETCHTYAGLAMCVHGNYLSVCKGKAA